MLAKQALLVRQVFAQRVKTLTQQRHIRSHISQMLELVKQTASSNNRTPDQCRSLTATVRMSTNPGSRQLDIQPAYFPGRRLLQKLP